MFAIRAPHAFDGNAFRRGGATVLVEAEQVAGVESYGFTVPEGCPVTELAGTLLPGLIDAHVHLVTDSGPNALDRVAGYSPEQLDEVVTAALQAQLAAGVTTVRDLGDRDYCVVARRDRQRAAAARVEPAVVASGPPVTSVGGHCDFMGGEVAGTASIERAVRERVERGVDIVKVMVSGGVHTQGSDAMRTQFDTVDLAQIVALTHAAGLPVTAHAHSTSGLEQAIEVGVDGIEHCTCMTERGLGQVTEQTLDALARSHASVCPTLGADPDLMAVPPGPFRALLDRMGLTYDQFLRQRLDHVSRMRRAGVRLVSGLDAGIQPTKRHGLLALAVCDLVDAGFSVAEAVVTATSDGARACGLGERKGRLVSGYDADLLVVDGDLENDPLALRRPLAVFLSGAQVL